MKKVIGLFGIASNCFRCFGIRSSELDTWKCGDGLAVGVILVSFVMVVRVPLLVVL